MAVEDVVAMAATYSAVITASAEDREVVLSRARVAVDEQFGGAPVIDFPMRTWAWRADRVARWKRVRPGAGQAPQPSHQQASIHSRREPRVVTSLVQRLRCGRR